MTLQKHVFSFSSLLREQNLVDISSNVRCHENARYSFRTSLERLVQATGSAEWSEDESKELQNVLE